MTDRSPEPEFEPDFQVVDDNGEPVGRRRKRLVRAAAMATVTLGVLAGTGYAGWTVLAPAPQREAGRKAEIVIGRTDYPEIKDGVPAIAPARSSVRIIPGASPTNASGFSQPAEPGKAPMEAGALAALVTQTSQPQAPQAAIVPKAAAARPVSAKPAAAEAASALEAKAEPAPAAPAAGRPDVVPPRRPAPAVAAAPNASPAPTQTGSLPPANQAAAPLPPASPARTAKAEPKPAPTSATARPVQATAQTQPAAPPAGVAPQAVAGRGDQDDHIDVFGIQMPTIGAAARKVREGAEALGSAVATFPERL